MTKSNVTWIVIAVLALVLVGMFVQNKYEFLGSVIPATSGSANQQCSFIADLNPLYLTSWTCDKFSGAHWISYDINGDGQLEQFGKWYTHSVNQGDACDYRYPEAAILDIPGIDQVEVRYGKPTEGASQNRLIICCGGDAWAYEQGKGSYAQAATSCPTYNPGNCTPNWIVGIWGECFNNIQSRNVIDSNNCGTTLNKPATQQACTPITSCTAANYQYSLSPNTCPSSGQQTKIYTKVGNCQGGMSQPANEVVSCTYNPSCVPDNSCAANTCTGSTCTNNCGSVISGTKTTGTCVSSGTITVYRISNNVCSSATINSGTQTATDYLTLALCQANIDNENVQCTDNQMNLFGNCFDKTLFYLILAVIAGLIIFMAVKK